MSITQSIHRGAHRYGEKPALIFAERSTSYRELLRQVACCAGGFVALDPIKRGNIGILCANSDRAIITFYGASWAGWTPNYLNIRWSAHELSASVDDFTPSILIVDDDFMAMGLELRKRCPSIRFLIYTGEQDTLPHGVLRYTDFITSASAIEDRSGAPEEVAFLNYTGGTTGRGKGVIHTHASHIAGMNMCIAEGAFIRGNSFLATPLFHVSGIAVANSSLMLGNSLFILPSFEPNQLLQLIQDKAIEQGLLVPTMLKLLLDHPTYGDFDLSSFRHLSYGGSSIDETVLAEARAKMPGVSFTQLYGQTECVPATLLHDIDHSEHAGHSKSAGTPCYGVELEIRDQEGRTLPRGEIGEICLKGQNLMQGYLNNPEQTAAALRDGWLITGDAGYRSKEGYLYVLDRIKDMIISGGENIYSVEVESALYRHAAVQQCAVIGLPHDTWGEIVHAQVRLKPDALITTTALLEHCRQFLAGYKVPKSIEYVEFIPITAAGKVDKLAIRNEY